MKTYETLKNEYVELTKEYLLKFKRTLEDNDPIITEEYDRLFDKIIKIEEKMYNFITDNDEITDSDYRSLISESNHMYQQFRNRRRCLIFSPFLIRTTNYNDHRI